VPVAGEQPQLSELPAPEITGGTILVRVKAAWAQRRRQRHRPGLGTASEPYIERGLP
jgi:hypothetical protein